MWKTAVWEGVSATAAGRCGSRRNSRKEPQCTLTARSKPWLRLLELSTPSPPRWLPQVRGRPAEVALSRSRTAACGARESRSAFPSASTGPGRDRGAGAGPAVGACPWWRGAWPAVGLHGPWWKGAWPEVGLRGLRRGGAWPAVRLHGPRRGGAWPAAQSELPCSARVGGAEGALGERQDGRPRSGWTVHEGARARRRLAEQGS